MSGSVSGPGCNSPGPLGGEQVTVPPMPIAHVSGDSQLDDANPASDFDIYAKARLGVFAERSRGKSA
jgi:hypothetical protein